MPRLYLLISIVLGAAACGDDAAPTPDAPDTAVTDDTIAPDVDDADTSDPDVGHDVDPPDTAPPPAGRLVINEVQCRPDPVEWVEVVNIGDAPVDLVGYRVTDAPTKAGVRLPAGELAPGEHRVVYGEIGISCETEGVFLVAGKVVDEAPVRVGDPEISAWGRVPDGVGDFVETAPTPQKANRSLDDERATLFATTGEIPVVDLFVSATSEDILSNQQKTYAPAVFTWTDERGTSAPQRIDLRIKGSITIRPWAAKPSMIVNFGRHDEAGPRAFRGAKKLALHNMAYDPALIREWLAYRMMREVGNAAPRVGWAVVRVNGTEKGLYGVVESYDEVFLRDWFAPTVALYEADGDFGWGLGGFFLDEGDSMAPLEALAAKIDTVRNGSALPTVALPEIDWQQLARMFALEDLLQHTDGMKSGCHNWFLHLDTEGTWSFMPWSVDLTLLPMFPAGPLTSCAVLAQLCDRDPQCVAWFERARDQAAQVVMRTDVRTEVLALSARAAEKADPRSEPWTSNDFWQGIPFDPPAQAQAVLDLLAQRATWIRCAAAVEQGQPAPDDDPTCGGFAGPNDPNNPPKPE